MLKRRRYFPLPCINICVLLIFYFEYPLKTWGNLFFQPFNLLIRGQMIDFMEYIEIFLSRRLFNLLIGGSNCRFHRKYWNFLELSTSLSGDPYSWFHGNITTFSTFRPLNQWSKWLISWKYIAFFWTFDPHFFIY